MPAKTTIRGDCSVWRRKICCTNLNASSLAHRAWLFLLSFLLSFLFSFLSGDVKTGVEIDSASNNWFFSICSICCINSKCLLIADLTPYPREHYPDAQCSLGFLLKW